MGFAQQKNNKSFTLIELLVVLALVAILSVVVVMALNPAELIKQARDSNRLSDLSTINTALNLFSADVTSGFMGTSTVVYVSIPDNASSTCGSLGLPTLPTGYIYNCVTTTNLRNTNGTGWIPVNFERISSNSPISQLPVDPTNTTSSGNYYTYVSGGSWILTAIPESQKQKTELSASPQITNYPGVIGMGNNLNLSPLYNSTGLVGYWKFDEGSGSTVKDSSGSGNNGSVIGTPAWTTGKLGAGMDFNGAAAYVSIPDNNSLDIPNTLTISAWIKYLSTPAGSAQAYIIQKWSGVSDANYVWYWYSNDHGTPNGNGILAKMGSTWGVVSGAYTPIPANGSWRHFVQVYDSVGYSTLYIDGLKIFQWTPSLGALATNSSPALIGQVSGGYRAIVDDFRIYNRALSAAEVSALYSSTR